MIRKVQASRDDLGTMTRANTSRVRDKTAGLGTNVQDIIMAVNRRINRGFNRRELGHPNCGAQTSLFYNPKLLKGLSPKIRPTQIVGISDAPVDITHDGYFCDNLQVD